MWKKKPIQDIPLDYDLTPIKDKLKQLYRTTGNPKVTEIINDLDSFLEKIKNS